MEHDNRHSGGGFFNGFILGLLVGAGLVFLFGTAKGKKVLQMLLEQVEENTELSELLEIPEGEEDAYFDAIEEEPEMELSEKSDEIRHEFQKGSHSQAEKSHKPVAKVKRFFRGPSKKLVS